MDEHPLARLNEAGVRVIGQVVRGESLGHARRCHVEAHAVRNVYDLRGGHSRVLTVRTEDAVRNALANSEARLSGLRSHLDDRAAALLPGDEGERLRVRGAALAKVPELDGNGV